MKKPRLWLCWSCGKDSAWALHVLRGEGRFEVTGLLTTVTEPFDRVSMHAVRRSLLHAQARAAGLPLHEVFIPSPCNNQQYELAMQKAIAQARRQGVTHMAFGDLYLEDVRAYRERQLAGTGITPVFPLWGIPTAELARQMIGQGLVAYITCVDPSRVPDSFAGRRYDDHLLEQLPNGVDPCAENGEFHTFAAAGPMFRQPIAVRPGAVVRRHGFVFADLLPADFS